MSPRISILITRKGVRMVVGTLLLMALFVGYFTTRGRQNSYIHQITLAEGHLRQGEAALALEAAQGALAVRPGDRWAVLLKGAALVQAGDVKAGLAEAQPVLEAEPQYRGQLDLRANRAEGTAAEKAYRQLLDLTE